MSSGAPIQLENVTVTDKPTSKTNSERQPGAAVKKNKKPEPLVEHKIYEDQFSDDEAAFYQANAHNDQAGSESCSSVNTNDMDPPIMQGRSKDLNAFLREDLVLNQRMFNVHEVLGNFPLDNKGRIINKRNVIK